MKICSEAEAAALAEFVARRERKESEAWEQEFRVRLYNKIGCPANVVLGWHGRRYS